jgi:mRNA interferase MazF
MTQRGDLVTVSLQGDYGKPRPALVIQSDLLTDLESVVLCPVTSDLRNAAFRVTVEPNPANGLRTLSQVMVDKLATLPRTKISGVLVAMEQGTRIGVRHALRHRQSSIAGSRRGRKAPFATASGIVREYRPCMLIWSWICGDKRATSSMRTSNPSLRSCSRATSM